MGVCLSKAASPPNTAGLGGSTVGATLTRRPVDADIDFIDNDFDSSSTLVLLRAHLRSNAPVGHGQLELRLYTLGLGQDGLPEVSREDITSHRGSGWAEWRVVHAFDLPQHFRLTAVDQSLTTAATHQHVPVVDHLGHVDFALSELLCSPGQSLVFDVVSQGVTCEMSACVAVAPGTLLQLDVASRHLQLARDSTLGPEGLLDSPVLHLARKQEGQQTWSPVLKAQAPMMSQDWRLTDGGREPDKPVTLQVKQTQLRTQPCFLDFLAQGARLSLMFAVDFSESNPQQSHPACMHHYPQGEASACEQVLGCTADLVSVYCESNEFTLWGFGGSLSSAGCYPLNGNSFLPRIQGVDMLLNTYHQVLGKTSLQGPLQLLPVLQGAVQEVQSARAPHNSHHLLVITISDSPADLPSVRGLLPRLSALSLSALLIGIGDGGFEPLQAMADEQAMLSPADQGGCPASLRDEPGNI
ncbi:hypothetical protein WJX73_006341 [Symbiochloris irregularis]|uniref:Copine C-terminal domain-containing protein n=1 Tax=Symbiochloris irregularis TaxID=706552 RepID=A0AAW1NTG0_9CHLO